MTKLEREQQAASVDEYGALDAKLQPYARDWRRREELAKRLRASVEWAHPAAPLTLAGEAYEVELAPCQMETRIVSMSRVYRLLGARKFVKLATITLKALATAVDPAELASLTVAEQTGSRKLTVRAKATGVAANKNEIAKAA